MRTIGIGNDHAGYELKMQISRHLNALGHEVRDFGGHGVGHADYPTYGRRVAEAVAAGEVERGILACGTGVGISIAANKVRGVRCVCCSEPYSALASRQHNDSNVLALGARIVGHGLATTIVETWLAGVFEGGRHASRVALIENVES